MLITPCTILEGIFTTLDTYGVVLSGKGQLTLVQTLHTFFWIVNTPWGYPTLGKHYKTVADEVLTIIHYNQRKWTKLLSCCMEDSSHHRAQTACEINNLRSHNLVSECSGYQTWSTKANIFLDQITVTIWIEREQNTVNIRNWSVLQYAVKFIFHDGIVLHMIYTVRNEVFSYHIICLLSFSVADNHLLVVLLKTEHYTKKPVLIQWDAYNFSL